MQDMKPTEITLEGALELLSGKDARHCGRPTRKQIEEAQAALRWSLPFANQFIWTFHQLSLSKWFNWTWDAELRSAGREVCMLLTAWAPHLEMLNKLKKKLSVPALIYLWLRTEWNHFVLSNSCICLLYTVDISVFHYRIRLRYWV